MKAIPNNQQSIYDIVSLIPKGRVTTYGAIAEFLCLGSARMVGWALNRLGRTQQQNIPAHRVVNAKGVLTGWRAFDSPTKMATLLREEGIEIKNQRVVHFAVHFWSPDELIAD